MSVDEHRKRVIALIRLYRSTNSVTRRTAPIRSIYPKIVEMEYAKRLMSIVDQVQAACVPLFNELPRMTADDAPRVHELIERVRAQAITRDRAAGLAARFADRASDVQYTHLDRQVRASLGVPLVLLGVGPSAMPVEARHDASDRSVIQGFIAENVSLITSIPKRSLDNLEQVITRAFSNGTSQEELAKQIAKRFDIERSRARFIARDQIGKLNGQVTRFRYERLGIRLFRWLSRRDKHVRKMHGFFDTRSHVAPFSYDGKGGYRPAYMPGEEVGCRCLDEAVFDDILAELDALDAKPKRRRK